jgi:hypothetical protein
MSTAVTLDGGVAPAALRRRECTELEDMIARAVVWRAEQERLYEEEQRAAHAEKAAQQMRSFGEQLDRVLTREHQRVLDIVVAGDPHPHYSEPTGHGVITYRGHIFILDIHGGEWLLWPRDAGMHAGQRMAYHGARPSIFTNILLSLHDWAVCAVDETAEQAAAEDDRRVEAMERRHEVVGDLYYIEEDAS